jgi:hypothetical protein
VRPDLWLGMGLWSRRGLRNAFQFLAMPLRALKRWYKRSILCRTDGMRRGGDRRQNGGDRTSARRGTTLRDVLVSIGEVI